MEHTYERTTKCNSYKINYMLSNSFKLIFICLFQQIQIKVSIQMNRWVLCGGDMDLLQYERENDGFFNNFWSQSHTDLDKTNSKNHPKLYRKGSEKVSLKAAKNPIQRKMTAATNDFSIKNEPQTQIQPKIMTQIKLIHYRSDKKFITPRVSYINFPPPQVNFKTVQSNHLNTPSPAMPTRQPKPCNIKINYLSPVHNIQQNPEIEVSTQIGEEPPKALKRTYTMPIKTQSVIFGPQSKDGKVQVGLGLAKSMDYTEPVIKNMNFKSTQNLHEIQCIKAESIADSEQELEDQFSIVVSPIDQDYSLDKRDLTRQIWGNFILKESFQKESLRATSAPETAEDEITLHL